MQRTSYFIEGLQGAGKSTLVKCFSEHLTDYKVFHEGDYSPVELAWCAYVTEEQYQKVLSDYPSLDGETNAKTAAEGEKRIICYTQILTDIPAFHRNLEKFEIYNGNLDREDFEKVILERFRKWDGEGQIFECSVFQNIIENQMLYLMMTDEEIMDFYRRLGRILDEKSFQIVYLDVTDIPDTIDVIRKERSDDAGNELWFPLMLRYLEESPYGKRHMLTGMEGLVKHLARRRDLEHRILAEIFRENAMIVKAKGYEWRELEALISFCPAADEKTSH